MRIVMPLVLLVLLSLGSIARADGPTLIVRHADGIGFLHHVDSINRLTFRHDSLVVATGVGEERHALAGIRKIELIWDAFEPNSGVDTDDAAGFTTVAHLLQNLPNPFRPETRISFDLPAAGRTDLRIYTADGRLVRTLLSEERGPGRHIERWDGRNDAGQEVVGGTYFYQLRAPGVRESRRMILLP